MLYCIFNLKLFYRLASFILVAWWKLSKRANTDYALRTVFRSYFVNILVSNIDQRMKIAPLTSLIFSVIKLISMMLVCRINKILFLISSGWFWRSKVCYGKYGCFYKHPGVRWGLITVRPKLPESPSNVGTKFNMYTRSGSGEVDDVDRSRLGVAKFNIRRRTIFLIHGWRGKYQNCLQLKLPNL